MCQERQSGIASDHALRPLIVAIVAARLCSAEPCRRSRRAGVTRSRRWYSEARRSPSATRGRGPRTAGADAGRASRRIQGPNSRPALTPSGSSGAPKRLRMGRHGRSTRAPGLVRHRPRLAVPRLGQPANPRDPADPAYDFSVLDHAVTNAGRAQSGNDDHVPGGTRLRAGGWRQPARSTLGPGAWKPKPDALGEFAKAVADAVLRHVQRAARVSDFEAWNEPNLNGYLAPQWTTGNDRSSSRWTGTARW